MQILIDGRPAVLKSDTSFDYVAENRLFGGADDYTLAITLPLADCPQNLAIFGHINRKDVKAQKLRYDCEIRCADFLKFGTVTITEISEKDIKVQFLAGRSEQNFDKKFDEIYINELTLGSPQYKNSSSIQPMDAIDPEFTDNESVALPWVNNDSGILHNCIDKVDGGGYAWNEECTYLSWQPYLVFIIKKICAAVEYSCDISELEADNTYKYMLICNCLPASWDLNDYARALPHWSVAEFFEKLELLLEGEFDIDHRDKKIAFRFSRPAIQSIQPVCIDKVVDAFTAQIKDEQKSCEYLYSKNIAFKECDFNMWKFYDNPDVLNRYMEFNHVVRYNTLSELMSSNAGLRLSGGGNRRGSNYGKVLYAKDVDTYFIIRAVDRREIPNQTSIGYQYRHVLQPVNLYGPRIVDTDEDADKTEIDFAPANIDFTDNTYRDTLFLQPSGYNESESDGVQLNGSDDSDSLPNTRDEHDFELAKPTSQRSFEADKEDGSSEYYNTIYIGWWSGQWYAGRPHPYVAPIVIDDAWANYWVLPFNFRINDPKSTRYSAPYEIDPSTKVTFKFLSDSIPNPRALFFIQGRRYVCEKITATFNDDGMSQLLKGEFYPVTD